MTAKMPSIFAFGVLVTLLSGANSIADNHDRNINVFSSLGELQQVNYAREAGLQGSPVCCAKTREGDVLLAFPTIVDGEYNAFDSLLDSRSIEKVSRVTDQTFIAFSGLSGDGEYMIKQAKQFCNSFQSNFGCWPPVSSIARTLGEIQHEGTIVRGKRPFGVQMLLIGFDDLANSFEIFVVDVSGETTKWAATAIGLKADKHIRMLEDSLGDGCNSSNEDILRLFKKLCDELNTGSEDEEVTAASSTSSGKSFYRFSLKKKRVVKELVVTNDDDVIAD